MAEVRRAQWYVQLSGIEEGPVTSQTLRSLADAGIIRLDTPIRKEGMMKPVPASKVKGLLTHSNHSAQIKSASAYQREVGAKLETEAGKSKVNKIHWSWTSLCIAVAISILISVIAARATGGKIPKNMTWTVMWMYLTVEAWRYWKWKALLPYPIFIAASFGVGIAFDSPYDISWPYIILKVGLNIGGLIAFYVAVTKVERKIQESTRTTERYQ